MPDKPAAKGVAGSAVPLLVAGMLVTGISNSLFSKYQDMQCVERCDDPDPRRHVEFSQPVWQTSQMFLGETLCLLPVYLRYVWVYLERVRNRRRGYDLVHSNGAATSDASHHRAASASRRSDGQGRGTGETQRLLDEEVQVGAGEITQHDIEAPPPTTTTSSKSASPRPKQKRQRSRSVARSSSAAAADGDAAAESGPEAIPAKAIGLFFGPALCDICGTTLMNVGLLFTPVSIYQMTRGALVLWVGVFSVIFLRRHLYLFQWLSLLVVMLGVSIVGISGTLLNPAPSPSSASLASVQAQGHVQAQAWSAPVVAAVGAAAVPGAASAWMHNITTHGASSLQSAFAPSVARLARRSWSLAARNSDAGGGGSGPGLGARAVGGGGGAEDELPETAKALLGVLLILFAQLFTASQFVLEEKIMGRYSVEPLLAVGYEGLFGFTTTLVAQVVLHFAYGRTREGRGGYFDMSTGWRQMLSSETVLWSSLAIALSIALFNFFGLSVTRNVSATARSTIDTCRTLGIWVVSLALGWEVFRPLSGGLQCLGFLFLVYGTLVFNGILLPPKWVRPKPKPQRPPLGRRKSSRSRSQSRSRVNGGTGGGGGGGGASRPGSVRRTTTTGKAGRKKLVASADAHATTPAATAEARPPPATEGADGGAGADGGDYFTASSSSSSSRPTTSAKDERRRRDEGEGHDDDEVDPTSLARMAESTDTVRTDRTTTETVSSETTIDSTSTGPRGRR